LFSYAKNVVHNNVHIRKKEKKANRSRAGFFSV
jgi:hypothetical protein